MNGSKTEFPVDKVPSPAPALLLIPHGQAPPLSSSHRVFYRASLHLQAPMGKGVSVAPPIAVNSSTGSGEEDTSAGPPAKKVKLEVPDGPCEVAKNPAVGRGNQSSAEQDMKPKNEIDEGFNTRAGEAEQDQGEAEQENEGAGHEEGDAEGADLEEAEMATSLMDYIVISVRGRGVAPQHHAFNKIKKFVSTEIRRCLKKAMGENMTNFSGFLQVRAMVCRENAEHQKRWIYEPRSFGLGAPTFHDVALSLCAANDLVPAVKDLTTAVKAFRKAVYDLSPSQIVLSDVVVGLTSATNGLSSAVRCTTSIDSDLSPLVTGLASTVTGLTSTVTGLTATVTGLPSTITGRSPAVPDLSPAVTGVTSAVHALSSAVTALFPTVISLSSKEVREFNGYLAALLNYLYRKVENSTTLKRNRQNKVLVGEEAIQEFIESTLDELSLRDIDADQ